MIVSRRLAYVDQLLDGSGVDFGSVGTWIGVAGTVTTLAGVHLQLAAVRPGAGARLRRIPLPAIAELLRTLRSLTVEQIRALPSMHPQRADVITGGALIAERIAARTPVAELIISESDILDGIALELLVTRPEPVEGQVAGCTRMSQVTFLAITVVGHDRPGIIARRAEILADCGMNLEDSSMTLLRGQFAMTLICAGRRRGDRGRDGARTAGRRFARRDRPRGGRRSRSAPVRRPLSGHGARGRPARASSPGWPACIAEAGGNITDLTTRLSGELYVLLAEVDLPDGGRGRRVAGAAGRGVGRARRRRRTAAAGERRAVSFGLPDLPEGRVLRGRPRAQHVVLSAPGPDGRPRPIRRSIQLCADLVATMRVSPGCVGLAAPQIGVVAQAFCVDVTAHPKARTKHGLIVLVNAEVVEASRKRRAARAACQCPISPAT